MRSVWVGRRTLRFRNTSLLARSRAGVLGVLTLLLGTVVSVVALGAPPAEAASPTFTAISAGGGTTCALTSAGGVECWGNNEYGELGDATTTSSTVPVGVSGLSSEVTAVTAGYAHTCALTSAGGVECWGYNEDGQLGNGTTTNSSVPVAVSGLSSGVTAVSAGDDATCALTSAGGVKCWGLNGWGELGNGTTTNSSVPVAVSGLSSGAAAVSARGIDACALTSAGGVKCWGDNGDGQLGNGTTTSSSVPVAVSGLSSGVTAISVGEVSACALTSAGGVKCWGSNGAGELGNGTTTDSSVPVAVSGLSSGVTAISVGEVSACARTSAGGAECWGDNTYGELGDNYGTGSDQSSVPVGVSGLSSGVTAVTADDLYGCALTSTAVVECWGWNGLGQFGNGSTSSSPIPVPVALPIASEVSPSAGPKSGGTTITITGTGFVPGATVAIGQGNGTTGAIAATVTSISSTTITATTGGGAEAGTFYLFVTTPAGTSEARPHAEFTYDPVPVVSKVSPNAGPKSGGTSITITGTGFVPGATVAIGQGNGTTGAIAATVTSISSTTITATTGGGAEAGTFNLYVTTPGGTSIPRPVDYFTYN